MRFAVIPPFVPFLRPLAVVLLATAIWGASPTAAEIWLASPTPTSAIPCYGCTWSDKAPWQSWMCYDEAESGTTGCKEVQVSSDGHTICRKSGFTCFTIIITVENDQEAVSNLTEGEELLADGAHFFVVDGDEAVVMRKCDLSVVARIPNHQIPQLDAELALATDRA